MDYFYDGQIRRYLTQFMRLLSSFSYKDAKGNITQVPVRYGDMSRQVAQILNKNSENVMPTAPFISCYVKSMDLARDRLQDPYYISKVNIRERDTSYLDENPASPTYGQTINASSPNQGANYTVERLMPTPYTLQFQADIWSSNTDQKLQLLEQILVLFRPAMEIQTTDNFIDWTSLSYIELSGMTWSSRAIPQGVEQDIEIAQLEFTAPIWLSTPVKVKKLGIITNIIANIFTEPTGSIGDSPYDDEGYFTGRQPTAVAGYNLKDLSVIIFNKTATLTGGYSWINILDRYPGKFKAGLSQIRIKKPGGTEIVAMISLDPADEKIMHLDIDVATLPTNTEIPAGSGKTYVDAIIDPNTFTNTDPQIGIRYLILEDINPEYRQVVYENNPAYNPSSPDSPRMREKRDLNGQIVYETAYPNTAKTAANWSNADHSVFSANANDIITWNGTTWSTIFNSKDVADLTYITNIRTGSQYVWDGVQWIASYEGEYAPGNWRLVL
jgi:hypothetical protein